MKRFARCQVPSSLTPKFALLALAATLTGCAIGPNYERPKNLPAAEQYRGVLSPQQAASFADIGWAQTFSDPELQPVIEEALKNNLDLQIAFARVDEYRGQLRIARSYFGPDIRGTGNTSPSPASKEDATYSLGFALQWELDLFGKIRRSNEAARAQLLATEDAARGVTNSLVASVATTWFQLRELDAEIIIIKRTIDSETASLELVRSQKRNGIASGAEEAQALAQLATTRSQLPIAIEKRVQTENLLRFLVGGEPGAVVRSPIPSGFPVPANIPVGLPSQLLARRPDLRQLENQLHAATANIGVAKASRFPYLSLGLTSFYGVVSPEISQLLSGSSPAASLFSVGPFVDLPIFQSGRGIGNVDVAEAQFKQAELAYRRGVLQAYREVSDALVVTDQGRLVIDENRIRTDAARKVLDLQDKRYRAGVVSYLDVLDAQRQLFQAEIDFARAQLSHVQGYVELYRALGGGW